MKNDEEREKLAVALYTAYAKKIDPNSPTPTTQLRDDEKSQDFSRMVDKATKTYNKIQRGGVLATL